MTATGGERFDSGEEYLPSILVAGCLAKRVLCYSQYELQWLLGLCLWLAYLVDRFGPQLQRFNHGKRGFQGPSLRSPLRIGMATGELL
jgi:hypothetical protein